VRVGLSIKPTFRSACAYDIHAHAFTLLVVVVVAPLSRLCQPVEKRDVSFT
jgi:hypothetical protein